MKYKINEFLLAIKREQKVPVFFLFFTLFLNNGTISINWIALRKLLDTFAQDSKTAGRVNMFLYVYRFPPKLSKINENYQYE